MATLRRLFPALYLLLNGVLYVALAWLFFSEPLAWFERLSIQLQEPLGYTELKTMYVGLMSTLGLFFLLGVFIAELRLPALLLALLSYALLAAVRAWGIYLDGQSDTLIMQLFWSELFGTLLAAMALACQRFIDRLPRNPYK